MLAKVLFSAVPHSASVERAFSNLGWLQSMRRNRLNPDTLGKLTAIERALHTEQREADKRHASSATTSGQCDNDEGNDQETILKLRSLLLSMRRCPSA